MRTAIVIPARLGATRLPGKPLLTLGGVPLVVRVARQARKCKHAGEIVVATDSQQIADAVTSHGERAVLTSAAHQSGTDRVAEAVAQLAPDFVLNVQGDEPFVDPVDLDVLASALESGGPDMVTLERPITTREELLDPNVVKVVVTDERRALYFSRAPVPYDRSGGADFTGARRHVGVYGYTRDALRRMTRAPVHPMERREGLEQLRALAMGMHIEVLPARTAGRGIDTEEDLAWARARVESLGEAAFP